MSNIGIIGTGNMGGALATGISEKSNNTVIAYDTNPNKNYNYAKSVSELCEKCEYVILTVKPNIYPCVLEEMKKCGYNKTVVTVAPGFSMSRVKEYLPDARVIRTMPNTPALVGEGVFLLCCDEECEDVVKILEYVGSVYKIKEEQMNTGVALSGSSPAFVYELINALATGAVSGGMPKTMALEIAAKTVLGSAKMCLETKTHPEILIDNVCSPGGTTIAAMTELEKCGFKSGIISAMQKCADKAEDLSKN